MEVSGRLSQQPVPVVLQGLAALAVPGILELTEVDDRVARVWWTADGPCRASVGHLKGEEALLACLFWREGRYLFRGAEVVREGEGEFPPGWQLSRFLLQGTFLAEELEQRKALLPPRETPLVLRGHWSGDDPYGCGVEELVRVLERSPGIPLVELEQRVSLAPVKVGLAATLLVEQGVLRGTNGQPLARGGSAHAFGKTGLERQGKKLRILVFVQEAFARQETFGALAAFLRDTLQEVAPWISYTVNGPSFLRVPLPADGLVSLCWVPLETRPTLSEGLGLALANDLVAFLGTPGGKDEAWLGKLQASGLAVVQVPTLEGLLEQLKQLLETRSEGEVCQGVQ